MPAISLGQSMWRWDGSDHPGARLLPEPSAPVQGETAEKPLPFPARESLQSFPSPPVSCSPSRSLLAHGHRQVRSLSPLISVFPLAHASFFHVRWLEQIRLLTFQKEQRSRLCFLKENRVVGFLVQVSPA